MNILFSQRFLYERFPLAVKQARELHRRLEYVNKHQNCELEQVKTKVECYRQELVESRARRVELDSREKDNANNMAVKLKGTEQELKMVRISVQKTN